MRLPGDPTQGKVRVCDTCAAAISAGQVAAVQDQVDANSQVVESLRGLLNEKYRECEAYKRVLLELEAEATDNNTALKLHQTDPENHSNGFQDVRGRVLAEWETLRSSGTEHSRRVRELEALQYECVSKLQKSQELEKAVSSRHSDLESQCAEALGLERERDDLLTKQAELESAVKAARAKVRSLELVRKDRQDQEARRRPPGSQSGTELPQANPQRRISDPVAITITAGREDPALDVPRRADRSCEIM